MTIKWTKTSLAAVTKALVTHHAKGGNCRLAVKAIWPHALKHDRDGSRRWQIWPKVDQGWYVSPKLAGRERPWDFHVVVETEKHCVDSLTGPDGASAGDKCANYLSAYFDDADKLDVEPWDGSIIVTNGKRR